MEPQINKHPSEREGAQIEQLWIFHLYSLCAVHSVILYVICDIFTEQSGKIHINKGTTSKQLAWFKKLLTGGCLIQCSCPFNESVETIRMQQRARQR